MGKIFFKKTLAIEWRAERMLIVENDKIVLNEPTVIAVDKSQKCTRYAIGNAALELAGQPNIEICRPFIRDGIVAHWCESHCLFSEILSTTFGTFSHLPKQS
ncbi:MAG: rod shape-determining protein [Prevotellaceae bacterium]|jgi:actin-like ATPase involved in cell morphogenesis|nr:rod shape-determining protein [Prevotellaceae bacterium]